MMETKKEAPERRETLRSSNAENPLCVNYKGKVTPKLSNRQKRIFGLLMTGKFSAADLSIALRYCDPRSYVRTLRNKGINVLDEWISRDGVRYKLYWVNKKRPFYEKNR